MAFKNQSKHLKKRKKKKKKKRKEKKVSLFHSKLKI
jgi:hypothetical protein